MLGVAALASACDSEAEPVQRPSPSSQPSSPSAHSPEGSPAEPSPRPPRLADVRVGLRQVATLEQPVAFAVRPNDGRRYVAEKTGRVVALADRDAEAEIVLDLRGQVSLGNEQGLLGAAFSPDGRFLYVNFTDLDGHTHVTEFAFDESGADPASRREVLVVEQPFSNHNGGHLAFGPDGHLYVGFGDGGSAGDPQGNGQSLGTLLGKIVRISPRPEGGEPYGVPPDNPFVGRGGARPEIWALGLRNPWRWSFDRETGDLWIGDVGQKSWEEVDVEPAGSEGGSNFGWNLMEASQPFAGEPRDDLVPPVYEYPLDGGACAVTGGYVYRGSDIPDLVGAYVFGDYCLGALQAFVFADGRVRGHRELGPRVEHPASFGEDADGELYVLSRSGPVYRIVPA